MNITRPNGVQATNGVWGAKGTVGGGRALGRRGSAAGAAAAAHGARLVAMDGQQIRSVRVRA